MLCASLNQNLGRRVVGRDVKLMGKINARETAFTYKVKSALESNTTAKTRSAMLGRWQTRC